jgi:hypothetical protein
MIGCVRSSSVEQPYLKTSGVVGAYDWFVFSESSISTARDFHGGRRFRRGPPDPNPPTFEQPAFQKRYGLEENEYRMEVADAESLGGRNVHCFARTTGLQAGTIGLTMASVKIYCRTTWSRSWYVEEGCEY